VTVEVLGLDGDDTLWRNEEYFADTQRAFRALLASYVGDDVDLDDRMNATERANLELFGYGVKGFTLSLIETAIEASGGRIAAADIQQLLDLGKALLRRPVALLEGVAETVPVLAEEYRLIVITKGDLWNQEQKLAGSGLAELMWRVEIVAEKDPATYKRILGQYSVRSDILPVLELGARAVHIPQEHTWVQELADHDGSVPTLESILDLPAWLAANG
jgi:putative hydrolase of the HAD superfamily